MMGEYDLATELINRAVPVKEQLGDQEGLVRCYLCLGTIYQKTNRFTAAGEMVDRGIAIADTIQALEHLVQGYNLKREIAVAAGDYLNAYRLAMLHQLYKDSLVDQATTLAAKEIEYRNQSKSLQLENENLRVQSDLNREIMRKRNALFYSIVGLALLLAAGLGLVAYFLRRIRQSSQRLEEQNLVITKQNLKLDQLNRNKDRMMSIIAHDLRGTIGNQLTAVEVLHELECDGDPGIDRKKLLGNLKHSAGYSLELLENLLHWSRLGEEESSFHPEEVHLKNLVENGMAILDESAAMKEVQMKMELDESIVCRVDKIMFETIIRNLISNAIKFSQPGGRITVSASQADGLIHLKVADQGIGMDKEQLHKITVNGGYTRRGTANEKGAGIGLTLVREFTQLHKGSLHIESAPGRGSTFEVVIPC
jgi:signal transduction histidine kinase